MHAASDDFSFHFFKRAFNTATKCVQKRVQQNRIFQLKVQLLQYIRKVHSSKGKYSVFFSTLMFHIQFLLLPSMYSKYFVNCVFTFVFVPTPHVGQMQQNSLLERSWNGNTFSVERD